MMMKEKQYSDQLHAALGASMKAAKVVMDHYYRGAAVEKKSDASPVTIADREAEELIKRSLKLQFPDYGFLGEETGLTKAQSRYVWVVDPIDGTKNFIRRIPLFGILIGLMDNGACCLGVSNVPGMQELLYGEVGVGAYNNGDPMQVSNVDQLSESMVSLAGVKQFYSQGKDTAIARLIQQSGRVRGFGDTWAYHLVASGRCEAVVEIGIKIWDIAALVPIIEAAGGRCTDIHGEPITVKTTSIVASNGKVHDEILRLLQ